MSFDCEVSIVTNSLHANVWTVSRSPVTERVTTDLFGDTEPSLEHILIMLFCHVSQFGSEASDDVRFTDEFVAIEALVDTAKRFFYCVGSLSFGVPTVRVLGILLTLVERVTNNQYKVQMISSGGIGRELI